VNINFVNLWFMMPHTVDYWWTSTFGGTYCLCFQGRIATLRVEVIYFSQMLVPSYKVLLLFTCLMN